MARKLDVWLTDKDGFKIGEVHAHDGDDFPTFQANAKANGHGAVDMNAPGASEPPTRPLSAAQQAMVDKQTRLTALRAKGWVNLSAAERDEASALRFDLGA